MQSAEACSKPRRRVDSKRTQQRNGQKAAASREPNPDVIPYVQTYSALLLFSRGKAMQGRTQQKERQKRFATPSRIPTTSGNCTRRPDTKRTAQSCSKVKPGCVTGGEMVKGERRNTKLRSSHNPARQRPAHDARKRRMHVQSTGSANLEGA